ncbi:nucleoside-diphosphate-sugar epimerase [Bradyrhizobium sp. CIR18]|nr:nucleoside-diphosphate-sugar epimerase [Bradyrhizobium sp. CIR18]
MGQRQSDLRSCYNEGKRCAETLFFDYWRQHRLPIKVVTRIFNTYGPRMQPSDGRIVSSFIVQALKVDPITIFADRGQTSRFVMSTISSRRPFGYVVS